MVTLLLAAWLAASPAVVQVPVANMFSGPSADADVVSQAFYSMGVEVLEERAGWARVRTPDAYQGWVQAAALRRGGGYAQGARAATVKSLFAHLYREASVTRHAPLLTVPYESRLEVVGEGGEGRWLQVRLVDDRAGWVQRGDVEMAPARLSIPEMLALSRKFLGLPYTWGGTTSFGYDCSGFTQMLCRRRGVVMPRDADIQAAWSGLAQVERGAVRPGDLLFFGASMEKITHTGLMLAEGEFIHATVRETPVIQVSRLDDPHWAKLLVCVRRVKE